MLRTPLASVRRRSLASARHASLCRHALCRSALPLGVFVALLFASGSAIAQAPPLVEKEMRLRRGEAQAAPPEAPRRVEQAEQVRATLSLLM